MIGENSVNSKVPDAKIPMTGRLPPGKKITDYYYSIPFDNTATRSLYTDKDMTESAGRTASGLNQAQQGQFVKGNKTLYEFDQIMQNADSKTFLRAMFLELTLFTSIKNKIKL